LSSFSAPAHQASLGVGSKLSIKKGIHGVKVETKITWINPPTSDVDFAAQIEF
jgi:hypothetical protein